ncbi:hypothetical protein GCM10009555_057570 [Acrocarpospora macrocephala]|uniref:Uncharacterized protein n=1 Tax=Acrocarpospora macrocephala TaxID=150177 RepID=A0A5M3WQ35_9ACTN|nr:hypothetical protein [Acrocarpospora macrocephala]GES08358.1 hypothetical protein Amac_019540 [Acrocarpospora macrocephala]
MVDIAKGVLGGAWALLVGWILPTALNVGLFVIAVAPSLRHTGPVEKLWPAASGSAALLLLAASVLLGLVLSALQNLLYRMLEGYLLWPSRLYRLGCARRTRAKQNLQDRLTVLRLERRQRSEGSLPPDLAARLAELSADPEMTRVLAKDRLRSATQRALLREKLARYPISDEQMAPTRLGNAIRRLEEYGYDRYRLDTQVMWNELTGVSPEQVRKQVDLARANVDFFIALLAGHVIVIVAAAATLAAAGSDPTVLLITIVGLSALLPLWYLAAVSSTDEWAASVRALVNVGRKPLAESLGLKLPVDLAAERTMWDLVTKLSRIPYHERAAALDQFRADTPAGPVAG